MDPIEKKFQEAFADYQFPVDDGLWDQVLEKKNRRKAFPWMRLAAAITLLILAGVLLWPEQSNSPAKMVVTSNQPVTETPSHVTPADVLPNNEIESIQPTSIHQAKNKVEKRKPSNVDREKTTPAYFAQDELNIKGLHAEFATLPQLTRMPIQHVRHTSAPVALPLQDVYWPPITTIEKSEVATIPVVQKIKKPQSDITGPARLVNVLEKNSPKLVKDILAFGSARTTEIEINW